MGRKKVKIPLHQPEFEAEVLFLDTYAPPAHRITPFRYFQTARRLGAQQAEFDRLEYERNVRQCTSRYGDLISSTSPDAVVRAPSDRDDAAPYFKIARDVHPAAEVVAEFTKETGYKCGVEKAAPAEAKQHFSIVSHTTPRVLKELLIVDESFSNGCTAAALLACLADVGFSCQKVIIASPLLVSLALEAAPES
jgi:hypothetical protein